ncbi:hypothetical protein HAX54_003023 [Datura stramonium]|uniref:Uncharacterized protein n=1 Tax=Datura stramonium TaxID=4076 RepID=A0ABS8WWE3_DATST|nr:hypothetical protein [Datura stramonium]
MGRHLLSSAVGDRHVAVWKLDGSKRKSSCCLLAMDHPAVFLDCYHIKIGDEDEASLGVLAISEVGVCYFWHGKSFEELHNLNPTKICTSLDEKIPKKHKEDMHSIFQLNCNPISTSVTALDRANAEGALLPLPKILDQVDVKTGIESNVSKEILAKKGEDEVNFCMEDQLRSLGIISSDHDLSPSSILDPKIFKGISVDAGMPPKKMKAAVLSMEPPDAYNLLKALVEAWQSGSSIGRHVLPWICCIMVNHNEFVTSQEPLTPLLDSLNKVGYVATVLLLLHNYGSTLGCQVVYGFMFSVISFLIVFFDKLHVCLFTLF